MRTTETVKQTTPVSWPHTQACLSQANLSLPPVQLPVSPGDKPEPSGDWAAAKPDLSVSGHCHSSNSLALR